MGIKSLLLAKLIASIQLKVTETLEVSCYMAIHSELFFFLMDVTELLAY